MTTTILAPKQVDGKNVANKAPTVLSNQQPNEPELMVKSETIFSKNERPRRNAVNRNKLTISS